MIKLHSRNMDWRAILGILIVPIVALSLWYGIARFQAIEEAESPVITFEKEGNLIKDNPGFEKDIWYLAYEVPGQPGLSVPLVFDHESQCGTEGAFTLCNISFEIGERVRVQGEHMDGFVHVINLLYL